mmetsp:Transcript_17737/g.30126  ORF Transcript_17737/g.30126 Transcript_17737/m.30126 type:complete len:102 (+) Transcript_17737:509-814(+)
MVEAIRQEAAYVKTTNPLEKVAIDGIDGEQVLHSQGYQLIGLASNDSNQPSGIGHTGINGSVGLHHPESGLSVGFMLNKCSNGMDARIKVLGVIAKHFNIQ